MFSEKGQSLIELVVVMAVVVIIVVALVFATIASLRNSSFAKNQAQATKLAQEVLERVRAGRDRNTGISSFSMGGADGADGDNIVSSWSDEDLWDAQISANCIPNCYFAVEANGTLVYKGAGTTVPSSIMEVNGFRQAVILSDTSVGTPPAYTVKKIVTSLVLWTDFAGDHESRLITILRKIK